ncbi:MAG: antibiotic biosynthesis monooxygenase [Bacteroidota bacterium]
MFNDNIIWTLEGPIKDGRRDALEALMHEMVEAVRPEPGTLNYEWTIDPDGQRLRVYERYRDADAAMAHLPTWSTFQDRFMDLVDVEQFVVYSELTDELKEQVGGLDPVYMTPVGGFAR